jgi:hypothetical protein
LTGIDHDDKDRHDLLRDILDDRIHSPIVALPRRALVKGTQSHIGSDPTSRYSAVGEGLVLSIFTIMMERDSGVRKPCLPQLSISRCAYHELTPKGGAVNLIKQW